MKNYDNLVSPMLEEGLTVMIYAGVKDLICNWQEFTNESPACQSSCRLECVRCVSRVSERTTNFQHGTGYTSLPHRTQMFITKHLEVDLAS